MPKKNPPVLKSVAIYQLRALAVEIKKTPTVGDIVEGARQKKCPPLSTIREMFGGMAAAIKEAGLPPQRNQEFTEQELLEQLRDLASALGRPVTRRDVKKAGKAGTCARLVTFQRVFGNASTAFRKAGVLRIGRFSEDELIAQYRSLYRELGRLPTYGDICAAAAEKKCAGYKVFRQRCGTLTQLREQAGLKQEPRRRYTREGLIDQLKRLAGKLGRTPLAKELIAACRRGECADIQTFCRYFGGYNAALKASGLAARPRVYSRAQLIQMLQALAKRLGHRPTVKEVNQAKLRGECASAPTYDNYFGNLSTALRAAKLDGMAPRVAPRKPRKGHKRHSRDRMLEQLRQLGRKLCRPPRQQDVNAACMRRESAAVSTMAVEFGSFGEALRLAGFDVRVRTREYTRSQLMEQLQGLTRKLGRSPVTQDIERSRECAAPMTFIQRFGSLLEARKAAGLDDILKDMKTADAERDDIPGAA